ncbi:MAG: hypothetical protein ABIT05_14240 [Chitinophagaceae bacterium]
MTQRDNILQELNELNSRLANTQPQNVYSVPAGYFDGLADQVLDRIRAIGASTAVEELGHLSPLLSKLSDKMPYSVPAGYFEQLENNVLGIIRESNDYQNSKEELETISPFLSGLKKQMPYSVPQGYFETVVSGQPAAKIVSFTNRKWFRFAAAAMITGLIALAGFLYFNSRNQFDPVEQPYAWIKKSIKKVDSQTIDAFVKLADEELPAQTDIASTPVKPGEIKELLKDVSDKEIQQFLDETPETGSDNDTEMN